MSSVWFTSDLHLGHKKVIETRGFGEDTQAHDFWLADVWDSTVGSQDQVWVLGDLTMGSASDALDWIGIRPGQKHLIVGNHDQVFPGHKDAFKHMKSWMQYFESIQLHAKRKMNKQEVLLSHFPYWAHGDGPDRPTARYEQWRLPDLGIPLLHGHTHNSEKFHDNSMHVGIDAWKRPVSIDEVSDWVRSL
jgi:calcineurin-like phosphoesterase family protein